MRAINRPTLPNLTQEIPYHIPPSPTGMVGGERDGRKGKGERKREMYSPLEQFKINPIIRIYNNWIDLTINNSTIYMGISIIAIIMLTDLRISNKIIKNKRVTTIELIYLKIEEILNDIIGKNYNKYLPLGFSIFIFILINNMIGLVPYSFTTTSHIIVSLKPSPNTFGCWWGGGNINNELNNSNRDNTNRYKKTFNIIFKLIYTKWFKSRIYKVFNTINILNRINILFI